MSVVKRFHRHREMRIITLEEERQESDEEDQEDGDDATPDPVKDRNQVVASRLAADDVAGRVDLANRELLVKRADEDD